MPSFRPRALWCVLALFASLPIFAQDPAIAPQAPPNAIPEGTRFLIRLNDRLDTRKLQPGKHFKAKLAEDPFSGCVFVFRSRSGTAIRLLTYDGQGFWLLQN